MSNAAAAIIQPGGWHDLIRWISVRFAVYVTVALGAAVLFLAGATIYVFLQPAPTAIPIEILRTAPIVQPPVAPPQGQPKDALIVAQEPSAAPVAASGVFGLHLFGPADEQIGDVSDVIFDRRGNIQAVVVGLAGYHWSTRKYVIIPFEQVKLVTGSPTEDKLMPAKLERGIVPYSLADLRNMPMRQNPVWRDDPTDERQGGKEASPAIKFYRTSPTINR